MSSVTGNLWSGRRALALGAPLSCTLPTSLLREGIQFPNPCEAFTEVRSEWWGPTRGAGDLAMLPPGWGEAGLWGSRGGFGKALRWKGLLLGCRRTPAQQGRLRRMVQQGDVSATQNAAGRGSGQVPQHGRGPSPSHPHSFLEFMEGGTALC